MTGDSESSMSPLDAESFMGPFKFDSEILPNLGSQYLRSVEVLSIFIFFYGASASRAILLIHKFEYRSVCCSVRCIGRYLRVRSLPPAKLLFSYRNLTGGEDSPTARQ